MNRNLWLQITSRLFRYSANINNYYQFKLFECLVYTTPAIRPSASRLKVGFLSQVIVSLIQ